MRTMRLRLSDDDGMRVRSVERTIFLHDRIILQDEFMLLLPRMVRDLDESMGIYTHPLIVPSVPWVEPASQPAASSPSARKDDWVF